MILHAIRAIFVLAVLAIAISYATTKEVLRAQTYDPATGKQVGLSPEVKVTLVLVVPTVLALGIILLDMGVQHKSLGSISGLFFGVVAGTVLAYVLGFVVDLVAAVFIPTQMQAEAGPQEESAIRSAAPAERVALPSPSTRGALPSAGSLAPVPPLAGESPSDKVADRLDRLVDRIDRLLGQPARPPSQEPRAKGSPLVAMIKLLVGALTIYFCVSFVMQTKEDFRFIVPYVEFSRQTRGPRPMLLDTSVIIDGRIADVAETRILKSPLIVPRFVLEEIQAIADSSDKLKRNRGRRGLDMLNRLQGNDKVQIRLTEARTIEEEGPADVDHKLVAMAKRLDGQVVTNDYNLNKIAQLRGVEVININDLANALKPVVLPGETLTVRIIKPGEELGQGIGYLDDGTMVVAEQSRDQVGQDVTLVVTSTLQTSAGRMIFGRPIGSESAPPGPTRGPRKA